MPDTLFKRPALTLATTNPYDWELDRSNSINQGLVGAWCPSLGKTGQWLLDRSDGKRNGTLIGINPNTDWVLNGGKYSLAVTGDNTYVDIPIQGVDTNTNAYTFTTWWKPNISGASARYALLCGFMGSSYDNTRLALSAAKDTVDQFALFVGNQNDFRITANPYDTSKWYFVAGTVTKSFATLTVNDTTITTTSINAVTNTIQTFRIGDIAATPPAIGLFDDIRFYNRALNLQQIQLLYRNGRGYGYRPRQRVYAVGQSVAPSGDINGTTSITFSQSATLAASGALAGTASLTFSQSGDLNGSAAAAGSTAVTFSDSSTLTASGAIAGDATIAFGSSATATGSGAMAGSAGVAFGDAADLVGSGLLGGAVGLAFTASATGFVYAAIEGSTSIQFSASATPFRGLKTQRPRKLSITSHRNNLGITTHGKNSI